MDANRVFSGDSLPLHSTLRNLKPETHIERREQSPLFALEENLFHRIAGRLTFGLVYRKSGFG